MHLSINSSTNPFEFIPTEINLQMISFLPDRDLVSLFSVCKNFHRLDQENALWKERLIRQLKDPAKVSQFFQTFNGWKMAYVNFKQMSQSGEVISPTEVHTSNKEKWIGEFQKGQLVKGKKIYSHGGVDQGEFKDGQLIKGNKTFTNGWEEGEFNQECNLYGQGERCFYDGESWKGQFENGELHGQGTIIFPNGELRQGTFVHERLNGEGKIISADGDSYEGTFKDDKLIKGKITLLLPVGKEVYQGEFNEIGELNGEGTMLLLDEKWEGTFKNGRLNGPGQITFPNGEIRKGIFKDDHLDGEGEIRLANGEIHRGTFKKDRLQGKGKIISTTGEIWEGMFFRGILHVKNSLKENPDEGR